MYKNENNYIPIKVTVNNQQTYWYVDISRLGLSSLIKLQKELKLAGEDFGIRKIDAILSEDYGINYRNPSMLRKTNKQTDKEIKYKKRIAHKHHH